MVIYNSQSPTDYLALIPAFSALVISLITSYYQFFRKTYRLIINIGDIGFMDINRPVSYSITVTNSGNTDIFLLDFIFWLKPHHDGSKHGIKPDNNHSEWPSLIRPGEIRLFKLSDGVNLREKHINDYYEIDKEWRTYLLELQTTVVLANGVKKTSIIEFATIKFHVEKPNMFSGGVSSKIIGKNILTRSRGMTIY